MRGRWEELAVRTRMKRAAHGEDQGRYKSGGRRSDRHGHSPPMRAVSLSSGISLSSGRVWCNLMLASVNHFNPAHTNASLLSASREDKVTTPDVRRISKARVYELASIGTLLRNSGTARRCFAHRERKKGCSVCPDE